MVKNSCVRTYSLKDEKLTDLHSNMKGKFFVSNIVRDGKGKTTA